LSEENPFRVLGIPLHLAMSLTQQQLKAFVKDIYRSLQRIHHPDIGGDSEQAQRINAAMEALGDEIHFMVNWQEFVSSPDPETTARQKEIAQLRSKLHTTQISNRTQFSSQESFKLFFEKLFTLITEKLKQSFCPSLFY